MSRVIKPPYGRRISPNRYRKQKYCPNCDYTTYFDETVCPKCGSLLMEWY